MLVNFILEAIFIDSCFRYSPIDKPFLVYFLSVLLVVSLGSSFRYSHSTNYILLISVFSNFYWLNFGILGNYFSVTLCMGSIYIYGWVILEDRQRRKKSRKKGGEETSEKCEELEVKGQALL